jgi:signal peptidase II
LLSLFVVAIDRITKILILNHLALNQTIKIRPFFNIYFNYNTGAAFSLLGQAGGWQQWLFGGIAVLVSCLLIAWLIRLPKGQIWLSVSLSLIIGGAIGNLYDRIAYRHVIDFLDVYYANWHWPTFNVADGAITVGAMMLFWEFWRRRKIGSGGV